MSEQASLPAPTCPERAKQAGPLGAGRLDRSEQAGWPVRGRQAGPLGAGRQANSRQAGRLANSGQVGRLGKITNTTQYTSHRS